MEGLEKLRPLIRLCQICGFLPFQMKTDPQTKRFLRFDFSYTHPLTCWFALILITQTTVHVLLSQRIEDTLGVNHTRNQQILITLKSVEFYSWVGSGVITHLVPIACCFYLPKAVRFIQQFDDAIKSFAGTPFDVTRRVYIGGGITLLSMMLWLIHLLASSQTKGLLMICLLNQMLHHLKLGCLLIMIHVCFYTLAHRIKTLNVLLSADVELKSKTLVWGCTTNLEFTNRKKSGATVQKLKAIQDLFGLLCRSAVRLNSVFSIPVLCLVLINLITLTVYIFCVIAKLNGDFSIISTDHYQLNLSLSYLMYVITNLIIIGVIFTAVDLPATEVTKLRRNVESLTAKNLGSYDDQLQVMSSMLHFSDSRIRLAPGGMFNVGIHLTPNLVGAIITYLVILLEFRGGIDY